MPKLGGLASAKNKRVALVTSLLKNVFATATRTLPTAKLFFFFFEKQAPIKPLFPFFEKQYFGNKM